MHLDAQKENPAETRKAFAAFVREKGWKEPRPECPRQEREAAAHYLGLAWSSYRSGDARAAALNVRVAAAIIREGEAWDERSAAA